MKKFEISPSNQDSGKKFEIQDTKNSIRATLNEVEIEGRQINWSRQTDANSCGYCLINNASNFLEMDNEGDTESIFASINRQREANGQEPLPRDRNLPTPDLQDYFRRNGYAVEVYTGNFDIPEIENRIRANDFALLYTTSGIHYVGIVPRENDEYYLLDSTQNGPVTIDASAVITRVQNSLGRDEANNRFNQVGLVYRPKKKFEIKKKKFQINR